MKKLILFSIIGILLISSISAGILVSYDLIREKILTSDDTAVLQRANITEYKIERTDFDDRVLLTIGGSKSVISKYQKVCDFPHTREALPFLTGCKNEIKDEKTIQSEIDKVETNWLTIQKNAQLKRESGLSKSTEVGTTTTELVTIQASRLIDEIGGEVVKLK